MQSSFVFAFDLGRAGARFRGVEGWWLRALWLLAWQFGFSVAAWFCGGMNGKDAKCEGEACLVNL